MKWKHLQNFLGIRWVKLGVITGLAVSSDSPANMVETQTLGQTGQTVWKIEPIWTDENVCT